jgi:hypothetical protein
VIDLTRGCSRYRPVLIDFIDRRDIGPDTRAALAHLDRCTRCTEVVESTMLTITALRRIGSEVATAEPTADAWPRLRVRIQGWRRRPVTMSPLAGIAMSFAIVAVVVLPIRSGTSIGPFATPIIETGAGVVPADRAIEAAYIASIRQRALPGDEADRLAGTAGSSARPYPDNYRPTRKEVSPAEPTGWPPRAI